MRKLLHQAFAVWASDRPYSEAAAMPRHHTTSHHDAGFSPAAPPAAAADRLSSADETTTAAGHKRETSPPRKVVTAAKLRVERTSESVKNRGSIDFAFLREQITLEQVLRHLGYLDHFVGRGAQRYGPCPFHTARRVKSRSFCVNLKKHVFRCCDPTCQVHGNALDLWATAHQLPLHQAAFHLAETFHLPTTRTREEATRNLKPVNS